MKTVEYSDLVKAVEENNLDRYDKVIAFCIENYGSIDRKMFQQIIRLYTDGFIYY